MPKAFWVCPVCDHEALEYDEVDHECVDENGNPFHYESEGDEGRPEPDDFDMER